MFDPKDYSSYGENLSDKYDEWYGSFDGRIIERIEEMAEGGPVFELGIGTGRIAIPLSQRGLQVAGLDASPSMLEKLKEKKGGEQVAVKVGNFASFETEKKFDVVFIIFNTIFALQSQEEQVNCFKWVEKILNPGGKFIVEAFVPDPGRFPGGQAVRTIDLNGENVKLECSKHDPAKQTVMTQTVDLSGEGIKLYPLKIRYIWPSEMDLMAKLAGLELKERWSSWGKDAFSASSKMHVSIYEKV